MSSGRPSERRLPAEDFRVLEELDEDRRLLRAHDRRNRRIVVLKILPPAVVSDPEALEALIRDVEAASRVTHPNLVTVLGTVEDRETRFVVMPHVEGIDLDRLVRDRGPLRVGQALDLLIQAARGLEAAHARGIVHGDLKPSSLMLEASGVVRVLGLGLGRLVESSDPRRSDPRVDVDRMGGILSFLLTGREPFGGNTHRDRWTPGRDRTAPDIRASRPDVPSTVAEVYEKMMAWRPEDRPASMSEVIGLLESCRADVPRDEHPTAPRATGRDRRPPAPRPGGEARVFAQRDESAGVPIGPEFDLGGLGIDDRPRAEPAPTRGTPGDRTLRLPVSGSEDRASKGTAIPRPVLVLGLAALGLVVAVLVRLAFRSGDAGPRPVAAPSSGGPVEANEGRKAGVNPEPPAPPAWVSRKIFGGKADAANWMLATRRPLPGKSVQPDGLDPHGTGSYLVVYRKPLGDFILDLDYKLSRGGNSGVFLRVGDLDDPVHTGLEVAIEDAPGTEDEATGAIQGLVAPVENAQKPAGEWNHMTITAEGSTIAVTLNGKAVSRINLEEWTVPGKRPDGTPHRFANLAVSRLPRRGFLGFQDLIGDCWFKNIVVKLPVATGPEDAIRGDDRSGGG